MKKITIFIVFFIFLSCKEKKDEINEPDVFLSFKSTMSDKEFNKTILIENLNKNLINDKFILDLIDEKLIFDISRNSNTIELTSHLREISEPDKYINELLRLFNSKYKKVESLHLSISPGYHINKDKKIYFYNWGADNFKYFRGKRTYQLSNYGFKQSIYYKAFNENSDVIVLIGYSFKKSIKSTDFALLSTRDSEKIQKDIDDFYAKDYKDIAITLNYFSKQEFESWAENIESRRRDFYEFRKQELDKDKRKKEIRDSISSSNINKI